MRKKKEQPTIEWYMAWYDSNTIRRVKLFAFTETTVTRLDGRVVPRFYDPSAAYSWSSFFPTFDEAKSWVIQDRLRTLENARKSLKRAERAYANARRMQEKGVPELETKGAA